MVECSECDGMFKNRMGLAVHLGKGGCSTMTATCDQCGETYVVDPHHQCRFSELNHHFCSLECSRKWKGQQPHQAISMCEQCGREFGLSPWQKKESKHHFCSRACYRAWRKKDQRIAVTCAWCGKKFKALPSQIKRGRRFCSTECANKWKSEAMSGANGPGWKGGPKTVVCKNCGKEFLNVLHRGSSLQFCSRVCADTWRVGENAPAWNGGKPTLVCLNCKKEFQDKYYGASRFCSRSCFFHYRGRTENEELIAAFLKEEDISFEEQYAIPDSNYAVDFFIVPDLIIETDGVYWHPEERDNVRDSWLEEHGYQIMHLDYYDVLNTDDWKTLISDAISVGVL